MRITIVNWSRRKVGGAETYIEDIIPELLNAGHQVAFWHEADELDTGSQIALAAEVQTWCVAAMGPEAAFAALRAWQPDVIYAHNLTDTQLEAELLKIAPAVFFAHDYYGTCISGAKTFKSPITTPCHRQFGWQCLAQYYPHRCGGLSPFTMLKDYRRQSRRLKQLSTYKAIVTHSNYMRAEYIKHGFAPERVHCLSYRSDDAEEGSPGDCSNDVLQQSPDRKGLALEQEIPAAWRLLFLGRMGFLKGGSVLIDALPIVCQALDHPLRMTFAGEGTDRPIWESQAAQVMQRQPGLEIEFVGWVGGRQLEALWNVAHLLVLPSVWPEPFGLVGPEAGLHGVPTAAFAVGGIGDWLSDGVNGRLASGDPPTAQNLADTIVKCLRDPLEYARLRRGALSVSRQFKMQTHLLSLLKVLESVAAKY